MDPVSIGSLIQAALLLEQLIAKSISNAQISEEERQKLLVQREQDLIGGLVRLAALKPVPPPATTP